MNFSQGADIDTGRAGGVPCWLCRVCAHGVVALHCVSSCSLLFGDGADLLRTLQVVMVALNVVFALAFWSVAVQVRGVKRLSLFLSLSFSWSLSLLVHKLACICIYLMSLLKAEALFGPKESLAPVELQLEHIAQLQQMPASAPASWILRGVLSLAEQSSRRGHSMQVCGTCSFL